MRLGGVPTPTRKSSSSRESLSRQSLESHVVKSPVPVANRLLGRTGMKLSEVGTLELNEAFASQSLAVARSTSPTTRPHVNRTRGRWPRAIRWGLIRSYVFEN